MTHDQTTPAPVEVTQADRDRAAKFISESDGDFAELAALFAAHRIAHSAPADLVEAVAWMYAHPDGRSAVLTDRVEKLYERFGRDEGWTETPLYTHPPAQDVAALEQVADDVHAALWKADKDGAALVEALGRQCDNMAFVLNHFDVPHRWYEKLQDELLKDRTALAKFGDKP